MDETLEITYAYTFQDQKKIEFPLVLKKADLSLLNAPPVEPPFWTDLEFDRCSVCSLDSAETKQCPIAVNLAPVVEAFEDFYSYESVQVVATTRERSYSKLATIQEGLSAMLGIIMVTSGCPAMERLKPMVRFHLPFAVMEETTYRMLSMYLIAQLYHQRKGEHADWDLHGLQAVYQDVSAVNMSFAKRLRAAASKDANVNAMVNLDCFAKVVPYMVEDLLKEMEGYFAGLLSL
jgi:uncharacterized protein DUF6901